MASNSPWSEQGILIVLSSSWAIRLFKRLWWIVNIGPKEGKVLEKDVSIHWYEYQHLISVYNTL